MVLWHKVVNIAKGEASIENEGKLMSDRPPLLSPIPLEDEDTELYWLFASYIGGLIIEWGRLERAIDILIFKDVHGRRSSPFNKVPGDFSAKLKLLPKIFAQRAKMHPAGEWLEKISPRIMEIKENRDTLVHGYFGSIAGSPPAISLSRRRFRAAREAKYSLTLSELDFQKLINDLRSINQYISLAMLASVTS